MFTIQDTGMHARIQTCKNLPRYNENKSLRGGIRLHMKHKERLSQGTSVSYGIAQISRLFLRGRRARDTLSLDPMICFWTTYTSLRFCCAVAELIAQYI